MTPTNMPLTLSRDLTQFCAAQGIQVRMSSPELIVLNGVPIDPAHWSKPHTNLCVIRDPETRHYLAWIDADLRARADPARAKLLTLELRGEWQRVGHPAPFPRAESAVRATLLALGAPLPMPTEDAEHGLRGELLPLVARILDGPCPVAPTYRTALLDLAGSLFRHGPGLVVLAGAGGAGLTACALEVLHRGRPETGTGQTAQSPRLVHVQGELVPSSVPYPLATEERVRRLLTECLAEPDWYLLDNMHWPLRGGGLAQAAVAAALERGLRAVATVDADALTPGELIPALARRLHWIEVPALDTLELRALLARRAAALTEAIGVHVEPEALSVCLRLAGAGIGADPGRCLHLLETAAALLHRGAGGRLGPDEVAAAAQTLCPKGL